MRIRNLISSMFVITTLVAASGCDSALTGSGDSADLGTAQRALTHDPPTCISAVPHISD